MRAATGLAAFSSWPIAILGAREASIAHGGLVLDHRGCECVARLPVPALIGLHLVDERQRKRNEPTFDARPSREQGILERLAVGTASCASIRLIHPMVLVEADALHDRAHMICPSRSQK